MIVCSVMPIGFGSNGLSKAAAGVKKGTNSELAEMARLELEKISREKGKAEADVAWWRSEFREAVKVLKDIAEGKDPSSDIYNESRVQRFHDFGEDGFI